MQLPGWTARWCRDHLGAEPAALLFQDAHMSEILGLRLTDGREVAVKSRPDQNGRAAACVEVQRTAAEQGFPCAAPLTGVTIQDGMAIHAEQWRPGACRTTSRRWRGGSGTGWPWPICRGCWATPTGRPRTCAGTAKRPGPCTTGTASPGCRRRRSPDRRAERSPARRRRPWRRWPARLRLAGA